MILAFCFPASLMCAIPSLPFPQFLHCPSDMLETPRHSFCIPICCCMLDALSLVCPAVTSPASFEAESSASFPRRLIDSADSAFGTEYSFNKCILAKLRDESLSSACRKTAPPESIASLGNASVAGLSMRSLLAIPAFVNDPGETAPTLPSLAHALLFGALSNLVGTRSESDGSLSWRALLGQNASSWQLRDFTLSESVDPLVLRSWIQRNAFVQGNRVVLPVCLQLGDGSHSNALSTRLEMSIEPMIPAAPVAAGASRHISRPFFCVGISVVQNSNMQIFLFL